MRLRCAALDNDHFYVLITPPCLFLCSCAMVSCASCVCKRVFEVISRQVVSVCVHCYRESSRIRQPPQVVANTRGTFDFLFVACVAWWCCKCLYLSLSLILQYSRTHDVRHFISELSLLTCVFSCSCVVFSLLLFDHRHQGLSEGQVVAA